MTSIVVDLQKTISSLIQYEKSKLPSDEPLVYQLIVNTDTNLLHFLHKIFEELLNGLSLISEIKQISDTIFHIVYDNTETIRCCYVFDDLKYSGCKFIEPINQFSFEIV